MVICVDEKENGKNGAPLKARSALRRRAPLPPPSRSAAVAPASPLPVRPFVRAQVGQKCPVVRGLTYEVRGGKVEKADIECSNGVIHVVDTVLIPEVEFCGQ